MADRQQNIRIKFTKDTAALDDIKRLAEQAQRSTDKLKDSAQNMGKSFNKGARESVQSLESMNLQLARLKAQISLTTDPKKINQLSAQYKELKKQVDATTKAYFDQSKAVGTLSASFSGLYNAVKLVLSAAIIRQAVTLTLEMAKLSGNVEGVERAFNRLPNSTLLLDDLRKAAHGTINDLELMQKTLQAQNFKIPLQSLSTLLEFAATRAQQTGQEVSHMFDFIVSGIGLRSIKRLDDLGFTGNRVKEALGGVTLQAATMGQVMEAVTKLMNEDLAKTGGFAETSATKVGQLEVAWHDLGVEISKTATREGGTIDFLLTVVKEARDQLRGEKATKISFLNEQAIDIVNRFRVSLSKLSDESKIEETQQKLNSTVQIIGRYNDEIKKNEAIIARGKGFGFPGFTKENQEGAKRYNELVQQYGFEARRVFLEEIDQASKQRVAWVENKAILQLTIPILKELFNTLKTGADDVKEPLGIIAQLQQDIEAVSDQLEASRSEKEIGQLNARLLELKGLLSDLQTSATITDSQGKLRVVPTVEPKDVEKAFKQFKIDFAEQADKNLTTVSETPIQVPVTPAPITDSDWEKFVDEFELRRQELTDISIDMTAMAIQSEFDMEVSNLDAMIKKRRDFYDEQQILAGDNERFKSNLRLKEEREMQKLARQRADAEKRAAKASILVNFAIAVAKIWAGEGTWYEKLERSIEIGAINAAQYAVADRARYYAKGEVNIDGPGTKTSDSIPARLSRGESVINADATQRSLKLLEGINAGKIDDRVLSKLHVTRDGVKVVQPDVSGIENAIKNQRQIDWRRLGNDFYEVQRSADGFSEKLRRRSINPSRRG